MRKGDTRLIANSQMWGALFWLAVSAFVTWQGQDLGIGKLSEPGSGFALFWIGVIMFALSFVTLMDAVTKGAPSLASLWQGTRWGKVMLVVGLLLVFGFFFERLGFVVCSLGLLLTLMFLVDPVKPWVAVVVSFGATFGVWYVLTKLLKIQMPNGILAPLLG
jgi:putative tricarboxylic transport membrane protein